jgi:GDPmannose 4,6-dehydratase
MRAALIFGVTSPDGLVLAKFLLERDYHVSGVVRSGESCPNFHVYHGDITDTSRIGNIIRDMGLNYFLIDVYNLASENTKDSFEQPELAVQVDALGPLHILEAIRTSEIPGRFRFFQACPVKDMYRPGGSLAIKVSTPTEPQSPLGAAKVFARDITRVYREVHGIFACTGITFDHASTSDVSEGLARFARDGTPFELTGPAREWGHALDYVEAMWLVLQQNHPGDVVLSTGRTHTAREFLEVACASERIQMDWHGDTAMCSETGRVIAHAKPTGPPCVTGDPTRAHTHLNWAPRIKFKDVVGRMVKRDMASYFGDA